MFKRQGGFTILETMIVTGVSAVMLITAIALFSGQQRSNQFSQSLRDLETYIQDVVNDVETGYYPNTGVTCTGGGSSPPTLSPGATEQGASFGCVFLGKALHFKEEGIEVHTVVGNRALTGTTSDLRSANPRSTQPVLGIIEKDYLYGVKLYRIYHDNSSTDRRTESALVVIASTPNGTGTPTPNSLNSGLQRINSFASGVGSVEDVSYQTAGVGPIDNALQDMTSSSWPSGGRLVLCFEDSGTGSVGRRKGGIVVAGGSLGTAARVQAQEGFECP